jgi:hypothetical protein
MNFKFTAHAIEQMQERDVPFQIVLIVLNSPDEVIAADKGRSAYQSEVEINGKLYIV